MSEYQGPVHVNVHVNQSQSQVQQQASHGNNGCLGCGAVLGVLLVLGAIGSAFEASPVLGTVVVLAAIGAVVAVATAKSRESARQRARDEEHHAAVVRAQEIRAEIEGRAAVDPAGGCMWCGERAAHRAASGLPVHPRDWHALEVEEAVKAAGGSPPTGEGPGLPSTPPTRPPHASPPPSYPAAAPPPAFATRPASVPRPAATSDLDAQLHYSESGECLWCGAPSEHRTPEGRVVHPARVHKEEYDREVAMRNGRG